MDELVGRTVAALEVGGDGQDYLRVSTDAGDLIWTTYGGCCSETWFADITGAEALIGQKVLEAKDDELGEATDNRTRQEVDELYGVTLFTGRGQANIVFRNSSNGYYGGDISLASGAPENTKWTPVLSEWSA